MSSLTVKRSLVDSLSSAPNPVIAAAILTFLAHNRHKSMHIEDVTRAVENLDIEIEEDNPPLKGRRKRT